MRPGLTNAADNIDAKPWQMCSILEGRDREEHMELSELECTVDTFHRAPRERKADPALCVKKYRRSAAGGGSSISEHIKLNSRVRSVQDLVTTVRHLLYRILANRRSHPNTEPLPLCRVVHFVDDRIRAIQVDYVTYHKEQLLLQLERTDEVERSILSTLQMQFHCLNYHLLVGYLLSEVPPTKFEPKFNVQALRTSLAHITDILQCYLSNDKSVMTFNKEEIIAYLDELMCYESLLHLSSVIEEESLVISTARPRMFLDHGTSISAIEKLMTPIVLRLLTLHKQPLSSLFPKWSWALRVASAYASGNFVQWIRLFKMHTNNNFHGHSKEGYHDHFFKRVDSINIGMKQLSLSTYEKKNDFFHIRSKICVAQALPYIRIKAIQQYNSAFMKCERMTATKVRFFFVIGRLVVLTRNLY
jgi:hypothetical protein